jgi:capsid protein
MGWRDIFRTKKHAPRRRGFDGAAGSRLFNDFLSGSRSADGELRYSLKTLRERARELSRNNDYARRYIQLLLTNVIGPEGIGFQNRARDDSFALDQAANNTIESRWRDWGRQGVCTVDGRMTWLDAQSAYSWKRWRAMARCWCAWFAAGRATNTVLRFSSSKRTY